MPEVKSINESAAPRPPRQPSGQEEVARPLLPPLLHQARRLPLRRSRMGAPHRLHHRRPGQRDLRAEKCRGPQGLVHDRHQHRGQQISARHDRHAASAKPASASLIARVAETIRDWGMAQGYFRTPRRRRHLPRRTRPHPRPPVRGLQFARLVQRGMRSHRAQFRRPELALESADAASRIRRHRIQEAAVLRLLHQLGERFARLHPHSRQDRRHALQVGHRHRHQSLAAARDRPKRSPAAAPPAVRSAS